MEFLFLIYMAAGYWAYGRVFEYNKVIIYSNGFNYRVKKFLLGTALGVVLIPIAIIRALLKV